MKVCIITCVLVPEAEDRKNEELEKDIERELKAEHVLPWVQHIEKVKVLSG